MNRPVPLVCAPRERIILRDADGGLAAYQNSRQTDRWRSQILAFNEVLASAFIELDGKLISEGDAVWVRDEDSEERRIAIVDRQRDNALTIKVAAHDGGVNEHELRSDT